MKGKNMLCIFSAYSYVFLLKAITHVVASWDKANWVNM